MLYTHAAAAIGGAVLAGVLTWNVQGWRLGEQIAQKDAVHASEVASANKAALQLTEIYRENADAALRKAEARSAQNKRDADSLHSELDRMRGDLAAVPDRISNATREAVDQYAATASVVFDQCVRRYSEVAGAAQGHSADVQTLMDAWPSQPR
jgi:hypothetical protein